MNLKPPFNRSAPWVLLLLFPFATALAADEMVVDENDATAESGGLVLEFDTGDGTTGENQPPEDSDYSLITYEGKDNDAGIEMIIGGQGKEGVAKRGVLPVPD